MLQLSQRMAHSCFTGTEGTSSSPCVPELGSGGDWSSTCRAWLQGIQVCIELFCVGSSASSMMWVVKGYQSLFSCVILIGFAYFVNLTEMFW